MSGPAPRVVRQARGRTSDGRRGLLLTTPYRETFIEELKALVPAADRTWDPDTRRWWVAESHGAPAMDLILEHWPELLLVDERGAEAVVSRDGVIARQEPLGL